MVNALTQKFSRKVALVAAAALLAFNISYLALTQMTQAAAFANVYIRFDRMKASTATTGLVCAKPGTSSSDVKTWEVAFPTGFTVSSTTSNWQTSNISTSGIPAGTSAWPNATSATASVSSQTVTWTNSSVQTMNTGTTYCYRWTSSAALTTSSAGSDKTGSVTTKDSGAATIDTTSYATAVISNDQINVTATVPPTFSFAISSTADDALSTLSTTQTTTSPTPRTITIGTNAQNGFLAWVKDANTGLTSASVSDTIDTSGTVDDACSSNYSSGSEFYGMDANETTDPQSNGSIAAEYNCDLDNGTQTSRNVGAFSTSYATLASGTGPTSGYVLTFKNGAAASAINKAATDYSDTLTFAGAGQF